MKSPVGQTNGMTLWIPMPFHSIRAKYWNFSLSKIRRSRKNLHKSVCQKKSVRNGTWTKWENVYTRGMPQNVKAIYLVRTIEHYVMLPRSVQRVLPSSRNTFPQIPFILKIVRDALLTPSPKACLVNNSWSRTPREIGEHRMIMGFLNRLIVKFSESRQQPQAYAGRSSVKLR